MGPHFTSSGSPHWYLYKATQGWFPLRKVVVKPGQISKLYSMLFLSAQVNIALAALMC